MKVSELSKIKKSGAVKLLTLVGVTRFELATSRPPDAHSNRTELHPESAKPEPTDIHSERSWGLATIFLAERISYALLRGFPAKALQN